MLSCRRLRESEAAAVACCRSSLQEARINAMATALKAVLCHSPTSMCNELAFAMQVLVWSIYICAVPGPRPPSLRFNFPMPLLLKALPCWCTDWSIAAVGPYGIAAFCSTIESMLCFLLATGFRERRQW